MHKTEDLTKVEEEIAKYFAEDTSESPSLLISAPYISPELQDNNSNQISPKHSQDDYIHDCYSISSSSLRSPVCKESNDCNSTMDEKETEGVILNLAANCYLNEDDSRKHTSDEEYTQCPVKSLINTYEKDVLGNTTAHSMSKEVFKKNNTTILDGESNETSLLKDDVEGSLLNVHIKYVNDNHLFVTYEYSIII